MSKKYYLAIFFLVLLAAVAALIILPLSDNNLSAREGAESYIRALIDGDWNKACDLIEPASREILESDSDQPCSDFLENSFVSTGKISKDPQVSSVQTKGRWAAVQSDLLPETLFLEKTTQGWLVTFRYR